MHRSWISLNSVDQILISHAHNDHIGDAGMIPHLLEKRARFRKFSTLLGHLTHNVENQGLFGCKCKNKRRHFTI